MTMIHLYNAFHLARALRLITETSHAIALCGITIDRRAHPASLTLDPASTTCPYCAKLARSFHLNPPHPGERP
jgi:hypothetical protein